MSDVSLTGHGGQNIFWAVQPFIRPHLIRPILFFLFFVSGFCGLLYQVIWTRMAFASFGIITPVLSVVLSVFMLGLALGSEAGGRWIPSLVRKTGLSAAIFYALAEFCIGVGAFAVPKLFAIGNRLLLPAGQMDSVVYLSFSALVLALSILPWCFFMGTTFPLMMAYIRERETHEAQSFSFFYVANVLGAVSGTLLTAVAFIEMFGFHYTLRIAAGGNFCIALIACLLGMERGSRTSAARSAATAPVTASRPQAPFIRWILFSTGFCAMAMEVVWTRAFTPVLKTQVYSFALIVFSYLGATFVGSLLYRYHLKKRSPWPVATVMGILVVTVFLPVLVNDPRFLKMNWWQPMDDSSALLLLLSICPFCAALGYLTPGLVDDYSEGDPTRAGNAYAINVTGCIVGPLFASYILLPQMSERSALFLLSVPFFVFYFAGWKSIPLAQRAFSGSLACVVIVCGLFVSQNFQNAAADASRRIDVRRDYAASVVSIEETNGLKSLLVNGIGMTILTPVTKFMMHMPLAFHEGKPQSALIICFGMGTTYRSALSWGIDTTAVELIPDVPKEFGFYHADALEVLRNPHGQIVIDDGRRFLRRTKERYDVIVIDPPPPVETAGSSLLYSTDFYPLIKEHLKPHGILQAWIPISEELITEAVVRSVAVSFPHVRCFPPIEGIGVHILASMDPIDDLTAKQLVARMPESAKKDLLEWTRTPDAATYLNMVLSQEIPLDKILNTNSDAQITDDEPLNEYFLLRRHGLF